MMGLRNLPLHEKIKVEIPDDIPVDARKAIHAHIAGYGIVLPNNWEWKWLVKSGDYAGTFPRRLANFAFKELGTKIPPVVLEDIGRFVRSQAPPSKTHIIDFDREFEWKSGAFGDTGSCYMYDGGRNPIVVSMRKNPHMYGVRFWDKTGKRGIARAWMNVRTNVTAVLFNAYSIDLLEVARVVATAMGLTYTGVKWTYRKDYSGYTQAYVNDKMFLIYPAGPKPVKKEIRGWVERK